MMSAIKDSFSKVKNKKNVKDKKSNNYNQYPIEMLIETMSNLEYEKNILEAKKDVLKDIFKNSSSLSKEYNNVLRRLDAVRDDIYKVDEIMMKKLKKLEIDGYKLFLYDTDTRNMINFGMEKLASPIILDAHKRLIIMRNYGDKVSFMVFRIPTIQIKSSLKVNYYHPKMFGRFYKDNLFTLIDMIIDIIKMYDLGKPFVEYIKSAFPDLFTKDINDNDDNNRNENKNKKNLSKLNSPLLKLPETKNE